MRRFSRPRPVPRRALYAAIIVLISAIYGILSHYRQVPEELNSALVIGGLLFLIEHFFAVEHKLERMARRDSVLATDDDIRRQRGLFSDLLKIMNRKLLRVLDVDDDRFSFAESFAIVSYVEFWDLLVKDQENKKLHKAESLTVHAIHCCAIDVFLGQNYYAQRLDSLQREFIAHGGKIVRILCAKGLHPNERYYEAYLKMKDARIDVRYYDIDRNQVRHTFGWDFLYVDKTRLSVVWEAHDRAPGGLIDQATYTPALDFDDKDLETLWRDIYARADPFPDKVERGNSPGTIPPHTMPLTSVPFAERS